MNSIFIGFFILTIAPPSVDISVFLISFSNEVIKQNITTTDSGNGSTYYRKQNTKIKRMREFFYKISLDKI